MADYKFKLDTFEGPMDLLMHLIEKNKIDIYDIPIAELTQQYLDYLDKYREFDIEITSSFLVMAATLLQIKSKMMLPKVETAEQADDDPRLELVEQILEYRKYKQISAVLSDMAEDCYKLVTRPPLEMAVRHLPPQNLSINVLVEAFLNISTTKMKQFSDVATVETEKFSVQEKMVDILNVINRSGRVFFSDIFQGNTRIELIVTFLALLELIKIRAVAAEQPNIFADIVIRSL